MRPKASKSCRWIAMWVSLWFVPYGAAQMTPPAAGPYTHRVESATSQDGLAFTLDHRKLLEHASVPATVALPDGRLRVYYVDASHLPETANVAESVDEGRTFTPLGLVITNRAKSKALDPAIVRLPDGRWRLYYFACDLRPDDRGGHEIHAAISTDGVHFTEEQKVFVRDGLVDPDVWWNGREWLMFVFSMAERTTIVARSQDGLSFEYVGPLGLPNWGTTAPFAIGDGRFRMFAFNQRGQRSIGSFVSSDGFKWTQESGTRLEVPEGQQITDPFVIRLKDGNWRMFFKTEDRPIGGPRRGNPPPELDGAAVQPTAGPLVESDRDALGYFARSPSFRLCADAGVRVIDFPGEHSFAALWIPTNYTSGRVMVLLHGSGGTAYEEIKDELDSARKDGYMLVSIQWLNRESQRYLDAPTVYAVADRALHYAAGKHRANPDQAALCGFSRGGAVSYEVAWLDAQDHRHFKLVICHSGGVPTNTVVAPRGESRPDQFFARLNSRQLATNSYHGLNFFLYSGDRDEEWGLRMSEQMAHAAKVLPPAGAKVIEWVRDPEGGHMGFRQRQDIHDKAVQYFLKLTPATAR